MGQGLDVVDEGGPTVQPDPSRKGRLVARLAAPVFHALEQRRLLAQDVAPRRDEDLHVEVEVAAEDTRSRARPRAGLMRAPPRNGGARARTRGG